MNAHAYFVLWIDLDTLRVVDAGIYSESSPTSLGPRYPVCVRIVEGASYGAARARMRDVLAHVTPPELLALLESDDDDDDLDLVGDDDEGDENT